MNKTTLLERFCAVNETNYKSLYDYCNIASENFDQFYSMFRKACDRGFEFNSKDDFYKLAELSKYEGLKF